MLFYAFYCEIMVLVSACLSRFYTMDIWYRFRIYCILEDMFFLWLEIRVTMCVHIPNHAMGTIFLILLKNFVNSNKMLFSRENVIFEIFISTTFVFKRDEVHGMEKVCGWVFRFLLSGMKLLILVSVLAFFFVAILAIRWFLIGGLCFWKAIFA